MDWKRIANKAIRKIAKNTTGNFRATFHAVYGQLEFISGYDLEKAEDEYKDFLENAGAGKTEVRKVSKLDVVQGSTVLKPLFEETVNSLYQEYVIQRRYAK